MNEVQPLQGIEKPETKPGFLVKPTIDDEKLKNYISMSEHMCGEDVKCSDLVIAYLYAGKYEEALKLSTTLAVKHPKTYEVVMTHAAALELNGKYDEALAMLKKGIKINPKSHKNSEWIHVKILEDRVAGGTSGSLLGLDFGNGSEPVAPAKVDVKKQLEQLHFQLAERIHFIPKEDKQFGSLLNDYAKLLHVNGNKDAAKKYGEMAKEYGYVASAPAAAPAPARTPDPATEMEQPATKDPKKIPLS